LGDFVADFLVDCHCVLSPQQTCRKGPRITHDKPKPPDILTPCN